MSVPEPLHGVTYHLKQPQVSVTINHVDGRPWEILIDTAEADSRHWVSVLSRLINHILQSGGEYEFLFDELAQVSQPGGGYWEGGKFWESVVQHIAETVRGHNDE